MSQSTDHLQMPDDHDSSVLITGVAGFIGSSLAETLLEMGYDVWGIDNFATGRVRNLEPLQEYEHFEFREADIRDAGILTAMAEGVETIFHQAAVPSVPRSVSDPVTSTEANCTGTATVIDAARSVDVDSLVVASSSSVYGSTTELPKTEGMNPAPESPYALSKYYTEQLALQASELYGIDTVALRYFNVFGPRQDPDGEYAPVIPKFINRMLAGDSPPIYGDGQQSRDFTYVANAIQANLLAARANIAGEVFNVGCGDRVTVESLVTKLNEILGTEVEPIYEAERPGDVRHSHADISKARKHLRYEPIVGVDEGLRRTVEHFRTQ